MNLLEIDFNKVFYFVGIFILLFNVFLLPHYREIMASLEWYTLYKKMNKDTNNQRIDRDNIKLWIVYSVMNFTWLFIGLMTNETAIFAILLISNIFANHLISKNQSSVKIKLMFIKNIVLNLIIFAILLTHYVS
jgi:hypothetical protein